jgi:ion channel-forming bestrophin family protein
MYSGPDCSPCFLLLFVRYQNDLDLDVFCQQIVHKDIDGLKGTPCLNAYLTHHSNDSTYRSIVQTSSKAPKEQQEQDVFGVL